MDFQLFSTDAAVGYSTMPVFVPLSTQQYLMQMRHSLTVEEKQHTVGRVAYCRDRSQGVIAVS